MIPPSLHKFVGIADELSGMAAYFGMVTIILSILIMCHCMPASAEEYSLYLPTLVEIETISPPVSGVLVKKIAIKRGDTLTTLSRKFSGKGSYFPQILLFNKIRNPDRIYAGRQLLVPVSFDREAKTVKSSLTLQAPSAEERILYERSRDLFARGECREALAGFTGFLSSYPDSSLAADAALAKADCLLRLSAE
jgi:LysM repeat protein